MYVCIWSCGFFWYCGKARPAFLNASTTLGLSSSCLIKARYVLQLIRPRLARFVHLFDQPGMC